jgi:hypothetical protein
VDEQEDIARVRRGTRRVLAVVALVVFALLVGPGLFVWVLWTISHLDFGGPFDN